MKALGDLEKLIIFAVICNVVAIVMSLSVFKNNEILFILYAVSFAVEIFYYLRAKPRINRRSLLIAGLFLTVLILPLIHNQLHGVKTEPYDIISIPIKILNIFILYDIYKNNNSLNSQSLKVVAKIIIIVGVISCIYNYVFCTKDILGILSAKSSYQIDIKSFFHNRNTFGEYMYYSLVATFIYFDNKKSKIKYLLIILFSITALITFSRSAIFCVSILIMYLSIKSTGIKKYSIMIVTMAAVVIIMTSPFMNKIENMIIRKDNFSTGRSKMWEYGINQFKESPFVGSGYYTSIKKAQEKGATHTQYHSFYIDNLAGYGIIGTIFIIAFLGTVFIKNISALKSKEDQYYKKILIAMYISIVAKMAIESVSFFSIGYSDTMATIIYITIPLMMRKIEGGDQ